VFLNFFNCIFKETFSIVIYNFYIYELHLLHCKTYKEVEVKTKLRLFIYEFIYLLLFEKEIYYLSWIVFFEIKFFIHIFIHSRFNYTYNVISVEFFIIETFFSCDPTVLHFWCYHTFLLQEWHKLVLSSRKFP